MQDELWTPQVLLAAGAICLTGIQTYCYCIRPGSITQSADYRERGESLLKVLDGLLLLDGIRTAPRMAVFWNQWAFLLLEATALLGSGAAMVERYEWFMAFRFAREGKLKLKAFLYGIFPQSVSVGAPHGEGE